jgi:hypothetical protein
MQLCWITTENISFDKTACRETQYLHNCLTDVSDHTIPFHLLGLEYHCDFRKDSVQACVGL